MDAGFPIGGRRSRRRGVDSWGGYVSKNVYVETKESGLSGGLPSARHPRPANGMYMMWGSYVDMFNSWLHISIFWFFDHSDVHVFEISKRPKFTSKNWHSWPKSAINKCLKKLTTWYFTLFMSCILGEWLREESRRPSVVHVPNTVVVTSGSVVAAGTSGKRYPRHRQCRCRHPRQSHRQVSRVSRRGKA